MISIYIQCMGGMAAQIPIKNDEEANQKQVHDIKAAFPELPVILGGHTNHENVARRLSKADGAFVGSAFEPSGWGGPIDPQRVREYMEIVRSLE